jgi:hypothetical protein
MDLFTNLIILNALLFILLTKKEGFKSSCISADKVTTAVSKANTSIMTPLTDFFGKVFDKLGDVYGNVKDEITKSSYKVLEEIDNEFPLLKFLPIVFGSLIFMSLFSLPLIIMLIIKLVTDSWTLALIIFFSMIGGIVIFFGSFFNQLKGGILYLFKKLPFIEPLKKAFGKLNIGIPDVGRGIIQPILDLLCMLIDAIEKAINGVGKGIEVAVNKAVIDPVNAVIGQVSNKRVKWEKKVVGQKIGFDIKITPSMKKLDKLEIKDVDIKV